MRHAPRRGRAGHTLPELAIALAVLGLLAMLALGRWRALLDRTAARMAAADLVSALAEARDVAVATSRVVAARVDTGDGSVTVRAGSDTMARRALGALHGVHVAVTRESVTWSPLGIGRGLANARMVVRRGHAAETVFVSRLGRIRVGSAE